MRLTTVILCLCLAACSHPLQLAHSCPRIISQYEYDQLRALTTVTLLPQEAFNQACTAEAVACVDPYMDSTGRLAAAEVWIVDTVPIEQRDAVLFHEICHASELNAGVSQEVTAAHTGWLLFPAQ